MHVSGGPGQRREGFHEIEELLDVARGFELLRQVAFHLGERLDVALQRPGSGAPTTGLPFAGRSAPEQDPLAHGIIGSRWLVRHEQDMTPFRDDALPTVGIFAETDLDGFGKNPGWRYDHKRFLLCDRWAERVHGFRGHHNAEKDGLGPLGNGCRTQRRHRTDLYFDPTLIIRKFRMREQASNSSSTKTFWGQDEYHNLSSSSD